MLEWIGKRYVRMQKVRHEEQGFTLIELLVVVVIIGILAAIAIPTLLAARTRAWEAAAKSDARNAASAAVQCAADNNGSYETCTLDVLIADYDFHETADVTNTVTAGDPDLWSVTSVNDNGGATFEFTTATGKVQQI